MPAGRWPDALSGRDPMPRRRPTGGDGPGSTAGRSGRCRWRSTTCGRGVAASRFRPSTARAGASASALCVESWLRRGPALPRRPGARRPRPTWDDGVSGDEATDRAVQLDDEIAAIERWSRRPADDLDGRRQRRVRPRREPASRRRLERSGSDGSRSRCPRTTTPPTRRWPGAGDPAGRRRDPRIGRGCRAVPVGRSFDLVQPDVSICGGIGGVLEIAAAAPDGRALRRPACLQRGDRPAATLQVLAVLTCHRRARLGRAAPRVRRRREPDPDRPR